MAELFKTNTSIRSIDLESNDLTLEGKNIDGIQDLCKSLETNETLLYMNLTNTNLNAKCGEFLEKMLEKNHTLIMVDVDQNRLLKIPHVRNI